MVLDFLRQHIREKMGRGHVYHLGASPLLSTTLISGTEEIVVILKNKKSCSHAM